MSFIYDMIDTWNNGATTFTAIKMNVTDTASAAGSLLLDLQIGGVAKITGTKAGVLRVADGTAAAPAYSFIDYTGGGLYRIGGAVALASGNNFNLVASTDLTSVFIRDTFAFGWSSADQVSPDLKLFRDAANILAQRNGTAAQAFRLYNTFTDASNFERLEIGANVGGIGVNTFGIAATKAGTGADRDLYLQASSRIIFQTNGANNRWLIDSVSFSPLTNGAYSVGTSTFGISKLYIDYTNTATVGAVTINKAAGRVNIAAAGTSVVVTNSLVTAASHVIAVVSQADATAYIRNVVPAAGSFTITLGAAATAQVSIDFFVVSAD